MKLNDGKHLDLFYRTYMKATRLGWKHFENWIFISPYTKHLFDLEREDIASLDIAEKKINQ